jgi:hypothetical protein
MNRYVFGVDKRVFEIHIESPEVPNVFEATCFEVLEGRQARRLVPVVLKKGDVVQAETATEQQVLLLARAFLQKHFENRPN